LPPFALPDSLAACYALPAHAADVLAAALATADLLECSARSAGATLDVPLDTPWSAIARARLTAITTDD
jgi:DNA-directed RNA polymerase specialized sigma24 family protein